MRIVRDAGNTLILRFDLGEEVIGALQEFCAKAGIACAHFTAIGAARGVMLAHYSVETQEYVTVRNDEPLEIVSLTGNVSLKENAAFVHAHGSFSDPEMLMLGGHVSSLRVGATCEMVLTVLPVQMKRVPDAQTGLSLLE